MQLLKRLRTLSRDTIAAKGQASGMQNSLENGGTPQLSYAVSAQLQGRMQ